MSALPTHHLHGLAEVTGLNPLENSVTHVPVGGGVCVCLVDAPLDDRDYLLSVCRARSGPHSPLQNAEFRRRVQLALWPEDSGRIPWTRHALTGKGLAACPQLLPLPDVAQALSALVGMGAVEILYAMAREKQRLMKAACVTERPDRISAYRKVELVRRKLGAIRGEVISVRSAIAWITRETALVDRLLAGRVGAALRENIRVAAAPKSPLGSATAARLFSAHSKESKRLSKHPDVVVRYPPSGPTLVCADHAGCEGIFAA